MSVQNFVSRESVVGGKGDGANRTSEDDEDEQDDDGDGQYVEDRLPEEEVASLPVLLRLTFMSYLSGMTKQYY